MLKKYIHDLRIIGFHIGRSILGGCFVSGKRGGVMEAEIIKMTAGQGQNQN